MIDGQDLVHTLIWIIVAGLIFWLLWWLISYVGLPEPFNKVARVILAVVAVIFLIGVLCNIAGYPLVTWERHGVYIEHH